MKTFIYTALFCITACLVVAQEPDFTAVASRLAVEKTDAANSEAAKGLKVELPAVRVPNGYGKLDTSVKDEVKKIIKEYNDVIAVLKERIRLLEEERSKKVLEAVPENQRSLIKPKKKAGE